MPQSEPASEGYVLYVKGILAALRRDCLKIILFAVLAAAAAAGLGKMSNSVSSTAQLLLTPLPLHARQEEDALATMLAPPIDATTVSLLCMSDDVLKKTMEALNAGGQLKEPIKYVNSLKSALRYRVSVAKETPYEVEYSPVIELTAFAASPTDAQLMVNAWAEQVVTAAAAFRDMIQKPAAIAIEEQTNAVQSDLMVAEDESEAFWAKNSEEYVKARLEEVVALINSLKRQRTELEHNMTAEKAEVVALEEALAQEQPNLTLKWRAPESVVGLLAGKLGATPPKDGEGDAVDNVFLESEETNAVYWEIRGQIAATRAGVAAKEAQFQELEKLVNGLEEERTLLQAQHARLTTEKSRVGRRLERLEGAYSNMGDKREYARVAGQLDSPPVQILSHGTEWRMPRFRRAILFGGVAGFVALFAAMFASVGYRMVLKPALEA